MSNVVTAKVVVTNHVESNEQVEVQFGPDYADDRNKEWAKYTPALSLYMTVKAEIADRFPVGQAFELRFIPEG